MPISIPSNWCGRGLEVFQVWLDGLGHKTLDAGVGLRGGLTGLHSRHEAHNGTVVEGGEVDRRAGWPGAAELGPVAQSRITSTRNGT